ncbi:hypothetical protein BH11PLA1_BH11PLA1_09790 [soil metagenome]
MGGALNRGSAARPNQGGAEVSPDTLANMEPPHHERIRPDILILPSTAATSGSVHLLASANPIARWEPFALFPPSHESSAPAALDAPRNLHLLTWTILGEPHFDPSDEQPTFFDPDRTPVDPHTWRPAAWQTLLDRVTTLAGALAPGAELWLRPHARHILSDAIRCERFLAACPAPNVKLLGDPVSLLTAPMLERAEDHLERMFESLARVSSAGRLAGIIFCDAAPDTEGILLRRELGTGTFSPAHWQVAARAHPINNSMLALLDFGPGSIDRQRAALDAWR